MNRFSLDCLTLPDVAPLDLVRIAAESGYGWFSLWVQPPAMYEVMLATPAMAADLARAIDEHDVALGNLEVFNLNSDEPIDGFERAIELGARLGAQTATAIDFGEPREDIPERFARFHALCERHDVGALVEPISMGNVRTPDEGLDLIRAAGVDAALVVDCIHLVRVGGSAETLRSIPAQHLAHVQICDGPAVIGPEEIGVEATANRLYPGEGGLPLAEILAAVPEEATFGVEVPNLARQERGIAPEDRAGEALAAARTVVEAAARRSS
jgi:sugar phosphate isomerase/epimerase